ncbi:hypothetical protein FDJ20_gp185 [Vibrio phage Thalassa]|uniref:Uncharacterized protein n=1 Tax=Vibrio phage Thalassa TaxID=2570301 RepID=A0A2H5BH48_9CAUD|nr:hypothetical protein FDJ20_gp185 [Vibrio phage Thalassa]AUG85317.1 hypothetical protein THALASSA_136 [Vibrio phage Thalassa]
MRNWFTTRKIVVPSSKTQAIGYTLYLTPIIACICGQNWDRKIANMSDIRRCADKQWEAHEKATKTS